ALLIRFFDKLNPRLDKLFEWLASNFENALVRLWWRATANFQGKYYQSLIYTYRDFRTQGLKTKGPFALDLEKVFVPLRVAPESMNQITSAMLQAAKAEKDSLGIWDFIARLNSQPAFQRIVVLGPPGSGKTTMQEHIALTYAQNKHRQQRRQAPALIPVLLYLRDIWEEIVTAAEIDLVSLIQQQDALQTLNPPPNWFAHRLRQGKCLVILDGLDEVADAACRQQVSRWVDQQMKAYPKTPFLLTSRPFGYRSAPLNEVKTVLEVQPLSLLQMEQFIGNWYLQNEIMRRLGKADPGVRQVAQSQANDLIRRIKETPSLASMALNPLLLTMIATVHCYRGALPGRRVELYAEICDVLLGRRQEAKGMPNKLTAAQKKSVLQKLALNRMTKKTLEFKTVTGMLLICEKLDTVSGGEAEPEQFVKHIENVSGLLIEQQEGVYKFAHKSFQEYLAAVEIKERNQEFILTRNIDDAWWDETIRLYAAQSDASNLIWAALEKPTVSALSLAYDCLEEGLSVQADIRKQLEETLERGLESTEPDVFKLAAEVKLTRRLNKLLRIDDRLEIDTSLITCAEYQLFIDQKRQASENRQPDHWSDVRFQPGDAQKPITGVRTSDAVEFCAWLTQSSNFLGDTFVERDTPVFVGDFKVRLPSVKEAEGYPLAHKQAGYWGGNGTQTIMIGIASQQWSIWQENFRVILSHALNHAQALDVDLDVEYARIRALARIHALEHAHVYVLDQARALDHVLDHVLDQARVCVLAGSLIRVLEHASALDLDLASALDRDRNRDYGRHDRDLNLTNVLDRGCELEFERIRAYLLMVANIWLLLSEIYLNASMDWKILRAQNLTRLNCQSHGREYEQNAQEILRVFAFFVLIEARRTGEMPAWEGIRIVREGSREG
ncbi:MAG: NACHT domain-containing protein, partial [Pseudanabaenales cyanobacterium]|nr:NACHT domain-containing protein [Pseudanabaenales cyanobacterium]